MRKRILMVFVFLTCVLVACSKDTTLPSTKDKATCPLTGIECQSPNDPTTMVMVNNAHQARPQTGLNNADVVVEMLAEGEITRFAAFYQSQMTGAVGPVRSIRDYFYDLGKGARALIISAGGAKGTLAKIWQEKYPHVDGVHADGKYFTRESFRQAPHNLYTHFDQMKQAIQEKGFRETSSAKYAFSPEGSSGKGKPAQNVQLKYHRLYDCGYQYDAVKGAYVRYTQGKQQVDRETSQPITMQNVMVVFASHRMADSLGHRDISITESGTGYLVQKGKVIPIEWRFRDGLVIPFSEGKELSLLPGRTWVNVLPETGKAEFR